MRLTILLSLLMTLTLSACGSVEDMVPDRRPDYRASKMANPLEVPPDLTTSTIDDTLVVPDLGPSGGSASLSDYNRERQGGVSVANASETVAIEPAGMHIERAGNRRWLVVDRPPEQLWPRLKEFWTSNGFPLTREDPRVGILETDWLENRADIPDGPVRAVLKQFLDFAYSAPTRDKFRVRLERVDGGSEIYLTHYGVEEIVNTPSGRATTSQTSYTTWQERPRDPELEAEMLNRLMVYLGASEQRAREQLVDAESGGEQTAARIIENNQGQKALLVQRPYDDAWRLVGLALDSERFVVQDQNRADGLYLVEYRDDTTGQRSEGLLSKLAFWRDDNPQATTEPGERFKVRLAGQGPQTLVVVHNLQDRVDNSADGLALLDSLQQAFQ